jgi:organic radical activating enzyme
MVYGKIDEVFVSIQGEGLYLGSLQIFIRLSGCNLRCKSCDTKKTWKDKKYANFITLDDKIIKIKNPINCEFLIKKLKLLYPKEINYIVLTGGEPLLQIDFLKDFLINLKDKKIYLETNGTLPDNFKLIRDYVDIVSLDIKLPSFLGRYLDFIEEYNKFIEFAKPKHTFIKIVINTKTQKEELLEVYRKIKGIENLPLVLQPASFGSRLIKKILYFQQLLLNYAKEEIRVVPQIHKLLNLR